MIRLILLVVLLVAPGCASRLNVKQPEQQHSIPKLDCGPDG